MNRKISDLPAVLAGIVAAAPEAASCGAGAKNAKAHPTAADAAGQVVHPRPAQQGAAAQVTLPGPDGS